MRRREFLGALSSAATAWPLAAFGQERVPRVGILMSHSETDQDAHDRLASFRKGLEALGWIEGRNIRIEGRYAGGRTDQYRSLAKELVLSKPDIILAHTTPLVAAVSRETSTIPIVFVSVSDPIGSGFVTTMARPGRNLTGLSLYEEGITGKWLGMLKEMAPQLTRAALVADPKMVPFDYYVRSAKATASSLGIEAIPSPVAGADDIERTIAGFAQKPNGGLIILPSTTLLKHRDLVIVLAARHGLPAVYAIRDFIPAGGLMAYSTDIVDQNRQAASYVDRILRGGKPSDLPVQAPSKYQTTINLKTAKALGLTVPPGLLVAADQVIE
jgi:putative ABC transport system substrate-binding protein